MDKLTVKFHGKHGENPVTFIKSVKTYKTLYGKDEDVMYKHIVNHCLRDNAKDRWFMMRHIAVDYKTLIDWLYEYFDGKANVEGKLKEWTQFRVTKGDSPRQMWIKYKELVYQIQAEVEFARERNVQSLLNKLPDQADLFRGFVNRVPQRIGEEIMKYIAMHDLSPTMINAEKAMIFVEKFMNPGYGITVSSYGQNYDIMHQQYSFHDDVVKQSGKRKRFIKCWKCGGNHKKVDCPEHVNRQNDKGTLPKASARKQKDAEIQFHYRLESDLY